METADPGAPPDAPHAALPPRPRGWQPHRRPLLHPLSSPPPAAPRQPPSHCRFNGESSSPAQLMHPTPTPSMPGDSVVIWLLDLRALRVLLAVALLSLPWLRAAEAPARRRAVDSCGAAAGQAELLLHDMRQMLMIGDSSVDLLLDLGFFDEDDDRFAFADRVLKHGGILAAPVGSLSVFSLPQSYCVIYIRTFAETFVGIKKIAHAGDKGNADTGMELPSPAALKEGLLSGQPAESADSEFKSMGRKLLLYDITGTLSAHERRGWLQTLHQDQS